MSADWPTIARRLREAGNPNRTATDCLTPHEMREAYELLERATEALLFYGMTFNYHTASTGFAAQYDPESAPVMADRGARARKALGIEQ